MGALCADGRLAFGPLPWLGYVLLGLGALASLTNFYLSFLRRPLFIRRGGSVSDYRHISGLPLVGMVVLLGLPLVPASPLWSLSTLFLLLIDTGNLPWFIVAVWNDDAFWGA